MGTDIHTVAQVKYDADWHTVKADIGNEPRSYHMFAVLADVRNGCGFAGVPTGDTWEPIAKPRGFPDGFVVDDEGCHTAFRYEETRSKWMGDHSWSWVTLAEIEAFYARTGSKTYTRVGIVEAKEFETIQRGENSKPRDWCGGVSGPDVRIVEPKDYRPGLGITHVRMSWSEPVTDVLSCLDRIRQELRWLASDHCCAPDEVRLVFGFDS